MIDTSDYRQAMKIANIVTADILVRCGLFTDHISQREAYITYGEASVRTWVDTKLIEPLKQGTGNSKKLFNRHKLDLLQELEGKNKLKK